MMRSLLAGLKTFPYRRRMGFPLNERPALALFLVLLAGCDQRADFYSCTNPEKGHVDAQGEPDPCFLTSERPSNTDCAGQCVPVGPIGWTRDPFLLYVGEEFNAPGCPDRAPEIGYEGHADLVAPVECGPCSCDAPSCELPAGLTASSTTCAGDGPGAVHTAFDAPPGWDGSCIAPPAVPANLFGSVTIAPVTVSACVPVTGAIPSQGAAYWKTFARACQGDALGPCDSAGQVCSPTAEPPPPGFFQCIAYLKEGETECPPRYPVKHVFYGDVSDTRNCTACTCAAPAGSDCSAFISYYSDASCTVELMGAVSLGLGIAPCSDNGMVGSGLQSMSATLETNQPGSCQPSGGTPYGEAKPIAASIFCCQE